jgi:hypothetical protein
LILIGIPLWSRTISTEGEPATPVPQVARTKGGRHRADPAVSDQWSPVKRP